MTDTPTSGSRYAQLLRFGVVGAFNTALDFALLFLFVYAANLNEYLANVLSTGICLVISFILNRRWTFRSQERSPRQFLAFLVVTLVGLWGVQTVLIWGVVTLGQSVVTGPILLLAAKTMATGGSLTWNYLLYSRFVFRPAS